MMYHYLFIGLIFFHKSYAKGLGSCSSSDSKSLPRLCKKQAHYKSSEFPQPLPSQVNTTIKIKQLLSVNEADETITIFVEYQSCWTDDRVGIRRSPENIEQNVTLYPQDNLDRVWTPKIYFTSMNGGIENILMLKPLLSIEDVNCSPKYEIELDSLTLPFQINFKALDSIIHSYASIQITLKRNINELQNLLGCYYGPTGIFAFLSMISFFIKPEMVSRCL